MIRQYELVERVKAYDPEADEDLINRAYVYSFKAHGAQRRASGDPYFLHPLEVAGILADMKLDTGSIVTGLLHDTVEDTVATLEDLETQFGPEIRDLVDGVTKLSKLELQSDHSKQAENFRKLVLAMSKDIRVLLVKLADRLHNMRTLDAIPQVEKRQRIARETLEIYAPLAERIGMHEMKDELEDIAFAHLHPDARNSIVARLAYLRQESGDLVKDTLAELEGVLREGGLATATVTGREKRPYSIWRKMQHKSVAFELLADIMAFRILVDDVGECYQALGCIHGRYKSLPGRFKDYISTPKPNGYQSLHTGVIGPLQQRVEIQIRTREMHEVAELGVAAHWAYKQIGGGRVDGPQYRWLRELLEILEHAQRPEEFLEHTKLALFQDQVFCFTPKGMLIALPRGATPVDFAYAVHSEVGDTCVGAKVNGRLVQLRQALENGDQVEVLTSKTSTPSPEWERFVVTGKARARIRRLIRQKKRQQYAELGRAILQKLFRQEGYDFTEKAVEGVVKTFQQASVEDVYANVGSGVTPARDVFNAVFPGHRAAVAKDKDDKVVPLAKARQRQAREQTGAVPIRGLIPGMAVHYARCCHPIPGDRIVGIVTTGKGVTIHTIDCETLESFYDSPERWLDVAWDDEAAEEHTGRLHAVIANEPGSLGTLSTVIGKNGGNITNLKITSRSTDFFEMLIDIDVQDLKHLSNIIAALRATPVISAVERARSG
ncbi:MAG: bifunctional (p)ppGpp synthetase/guanosine-3',5'-bis(diphosphate) 3'-pyrophosphohydrolase [Azospirillaceae bacterium]